jgi:hypothetical protein
MIRFVRMRNTKFKSEILKGKAIWKPEVCRWEDNIKIYFNENKSEGTNWILVHSFHNKR